MFFSLCQGSLVTSLISLQATKVPTDHFLLFHESKVLPIISGVLYGYKGVVQILALLLAFRTRKIKVKGLDDAKGIISAVYISSVGVTLLVVSKFLLEGYISGFVILPACCVILTTTAVMALVFLPLVSELSSESE